MASLFMYAAITLDGSATVSPSRTVATAKAHHSRVTKAVDEIEMQRRRIDIIRVIAAVI